jgi:hypothetical protein
MVPIGWQKVVNCLHQIQGGTNNGDDEGTLKLQKNVLIE